MNEWRRVSPIAIIYFLFDSLRQAVNLWPALVPLVAGGEGFRQLFFTFGLPGLLVVFVLSVLLHFWFFRFRIEADRIQLHTGVFNRKRLTLYFERVQQADIAQPFYFRPFGLATLGLESAGSRQQEVDIPGLSFDVAQQLKDSILAHQAAEQETVADVVEVEQPPDYELHLDWPEVARYGLMFNGLLLFAPVLAPFLDDLAPSVEAWISGLEGTAAHELLVQSTRSELIWLVGVLSVFALLAAIALLFFISMLIALVRFWDYRLTRHGDQFQYRAGLGTVKTRGFRLHKLQQISISQGLVARLLKRYTLTISKAGSAAPVGDVEDSRRFLVPVLDRNGLTALTAQLSIPTLRWRRVSPLYVPWYGASVAFCLSVLLTVIARDHQWYPVVLLFIWMTSFLYFWRRWRCLGIYQDDNWVGLCSGLVGRKVVLLPIGKAQKTSISEPPWLKAWGLAHLSVWGAAGRIDMPFVSRSDADDIRDQTLYRVVTFQGRWF
ncbi:PH domain-containing protein [Proteobacteria bacterium 005FR1]|nr:PH domain-containing protein [Proteobacteria bacterium 005FR1]